MSKQKSSEHDHQAGSVEETNREPCRTSKTSLFFNSSLGHSNLLRIRFEGKRRPWKCLSAAMLTVQPHIHQHQQRWAFSKRWLTGRLDNSWTRAFSLCWYRRMVFFFSGLIVCQVWALWLRQHCQIWEKTARLVLQQSSHSNSQVWPLKYFRYYLLF